MIFMQRQMQKKCRDQNIGLYAAFVDLTKAFDTVNREGLWKFLASLACSQKILTILRQFREDQKRRQAGMCPGPTLFSIFFSIMLHEAKEDLPDGIYIRFQTDGSLFNLRRLFARTKTIEELITELLFADDCALLAHMEKALQHIVNCFSDAAKNFVLTIILEKTYMLYQPPPREVYSPSHISADSTNLNEWDTSLTSVAPFPMMPQSARILTTACPRPTVPLEDCQREYSRATRSVSPRSSRFTGPSSLPPSCTVQRPGFSIALHPLHQMARPRVKRRSPQESQPVLPSIESILLQVQQR